MSEDESELIIQSEFACERLRELMEKTGMTEAELIDEALRFYVAPIRLEK